MIDQFVIHGFSLAHRTPPRGPFWPHHVIVAIITEANRAFRYNAELFACLDPKKTLEAEPLRQSSVAATTGASLGAVLALVLAVSMAHFFLVVGGFTGSSGLNKLDTVFAWIRHEISTRLDL